MQQRKLGKNGPLVSALGLGCMGLSCFYGPPVQESLALEAIQAAFDQGVTFFDTADMYGNGHNEILLGNAIASFRNKVVVATKCGIEFDGVSLKVHNTPEYIWKACDASLKRLQMDTIDLFFLHRVTKDVAIEESMSAMKTLIDKGKIRFVGLSEVDAQTLEGAHRVLGDKLVALQSEFSILNHKEAEEMLPTCRKLGISFIAFAPLGRGMLTGRLKDTNEFTQSGAFDLRTISPQFQPDTFLHNLHLVQALETIAQKKKCTTSQLALAWLLAKGEDVIPIPGSGKIKNLMENLGAVQVNLTSNDMKDITLAMQANPVHGVRLPP